MHLLAHFSVAAFIVSALVYFLIGWLWYSKVLFGKLYVFKDCGQDLFNAKR